MVARVMILAGGTGGHVFPALAVADDLRARGAEVIWMGTRRGIEARVVPGAGYRMEWIGVSGLRGGGAGRWLLAPFRLLVALLQAGRIILRRKPSVLLGMGGFVTGPGGLAACLMRIPLVLHEQNAVAGLTNRLLARCASRLLEAFPGSLPAGAKTLHTGNPVRAAISRIEPPELRMRERPGALRLLVLGGSQGAAALNRIVPAALRRLAEENRPAVRHQSGNLHLAEARARYRQAGLPVKVEPFIEDMAAAYAWADVVLCRAGALTIAELTATGVASVLVPYPHAVDDHQTRNAAHLVAAGAAMLLPENDLGEDTLADLLQILAADRQKLTDMACRARALANPDAATVVADVCLEMAGHNQ